MSFPNLYNYPSASGSADEYYYSFPSSFVPFETDPAYSQFLTSHTHPSDLGDYQSSSRFQHAYQNSSNFGAPATPRGFTAFGNEGSFDFQSHGPFVVPDPLQAIGPRPATQGSSRRISAVSDAQQPLQEFEQSIQSPPFTDRMIRSIGSPGNREAHTRRRQTSRPSLRSRDSTSISTFSSTSNASSHPADRVAIPRLPVTPSSRTSSSIGSHGCDRCDKAFKRAGDLTRHQDTIHGAAKKYYACNQCRSWNKRKDKMQEHCQGVHKQQRGRERFREVEEEEE